MDRALELLFQEPYRDHNNNTGCPRNLPIHHASLTFICNSYIFPCISMTILCLIWRTTVTSSSHIPEEDAYYRTRNMCGFSHVQERIPGFAYKSFGTLSDVTVVLGMRQSICPVSFLFCFYFV